LLVFLSSQARALGRLGSRAKRNHARALARRAREGGRGRAVEESFVATKLLKQVKMKSQGKHCIKTYNRGVIGGLLVLRGFRRRGRADGRGLWLLLVLVFFLLGVRVSGDVLVRQGSERGGRGVHLDEEGGGGGAV
jgi:hypothetical protein